MKETMLELKDVSKAYASGIKIGPIDFTVGQGECVALCGSNGAGKSTMFNLITGQIKLTTGEISINGAKVSSGNGDFRKYFSYVPENVTLPLSLSGREILGFYASLLGLPDSEAKRVCEQMGLLKSANMLTREYSKGMRQRLLIAQALLSRPPLMLFDEPSNGLDLSWSIQFKHIIKELKQQNISILISSHILSDIEELADKVIIVNEGLIAEYDTMENLYKKYNHPTNFEELYTSMTRKKVK